METSRASALIKVRSRGRVTLPISIRKALRTGRRESLVFWIDEDSNEVHCRLETAEEEFQRMSDYFTEEYKANFRRTVMEIGGIKIPSDYECLPLWCRRRNGIPIDEAVKELESHGFVFADANALYEYLLKT